MAGNALTAGLSLRIPDVSRATNSASTYRTYQPSEIIGSTTPQGIDPGPPPPPVDDCGTFKQALVIIVAVVVTAVVAMYLPQAAGPVGKALVGAASAAAGSVASQTVAMAVGLQDDFSWKSVGLAALGGAVGGAINANSKAFELFGGASGVAQAVTSNVLTQGIAVMTGLQEKFSWQSVAVSGASAWINSQIPSGTPGANGTLQPLSAAEKLVRNFLTGTTTQIIRMAVYGQGKLDFASLAADAFGNVIGEAVAEQMRPKVTSPTAAAKPASVKTFGDQALVEAIDYAPLEKLKLLDLTVEQLPQIESPELATRIAAKGDSWARIAKQVYGDERYALALMQANGTTSTTLRLGQEVVLPDLAGADLKAGAR